MQGTVLRIGLGPRAGEAAVLAHMQLLTALAVSVAGWLPVHLGKMRFQGAALGKCFPASSAAEWPDPCADGQEGERTDRGRPRNPLLSEDGGFPLHPSVCDLNPVINTCFHSISLSSPHPFLVAES